MLDKVAVVGAGSWGTTVAALRLRAATTVLWARSPAPGRAIDRRHENPAYLAGCPARRLRATDSLAEAVDGAALVMMAVPSHGFRAVLGEMAPSLVSGCGLRQPDQGHRDGHQPAHDRGHGRGPAGPSDRRAHRAEPRPGGGRGSAGGDRRGPGRRGAGPAGPGTLHCRTFRVYTNTDLVGWRSPAQPRTCIAIAAGICDGLGFGENTRAVLITRGLAELGRLGVALGGHP